MLRHSFCTAAAVLVLAGAAHAADLPSKKGAIAPPPVAEFSWKGFYVGGHVGYAWVHDDSYNILYFPTQIIGAVTPSGFSSGGAIGGLHVGYNWAWKQLILGLEGDVDVTSLEGTVASRPGTTFFSSTSRSPVQGSIRGRLGYAFDRILVYATGGGIFGGILTTYHAWPIGDSFSRTRQSWTVGGGLEYAFNNNWSARVEYRYADFGKYYDGPIKAPLYQQTHHLEENQVKVGFSWKYSPAPPAAVLAKY